MGAERRSMVMSEDEKLTAYHEGGHAIEANYASDPIHKATIIPRGRARYGYEITRERSIISY